MPATLNFASGRQLPRLLFVTSRNALTNNISSAEALGVINAIRAAGYHVVDDIPIGASAKDCSTRIRTELANLGDVVGVVLVGGYDVVASHTMDCLPSDLRARLEPSDDSPDGFVVWSDLPHADPDADGIPELPITRVPDCHSADFLKRALSAGAPRGLGIATTGVRNYRRPFADLVFASLSSTSPMYQSQPLTASQPSAHINANNGYVMCHGSFMDATRFWGEGTPGNEEALNIRSIGGLSEALAFAGCCWGALIVDGPAALSGSAVRPPRTPTTSIALRCLDNGANAFVGCTGAHYSPDATGSYYGGPMHMHFWSAIRNGMAPAQALHDARTKYGGSIPHGRTAPLDHAIELKIYHQFTCLGLGW